jgi:hypothetical protein
MFRRPFITSAVAALCALSVGVSRADFAARGDDWMVEVRSQRELLGTLEGATRVRADWMHDAGFGATVDGAVGDAFDGGMRGDACAAWRLAQGEAGALDLLAGARLESRAAQAAVDATTDGLVALRTRTVVAPRVDLECSFGAVGGDRIVPEAESALRVQLDDRWNLGLSAGWRGDRAPWDGGTRGDSEGPFGFAVRLGLSAEF